MTAVRMAVRRSTRVFAWAAGLGIAAFMLGLGPLGLIDARYLDREGTLAVYFSAALLLAAGGFALLLALARRVRGASPWPFVALAGLLGFMGMDEWRRFHERLEAASGVDWQLIYGPLGLFAAAAGLASLVALPRRSPARALLVAGGLAWVVSQVLENVQWDGDTLLHLWLIPWEEMLEMSGSALFGLAMLTALQVVVGEGGRPARGPRR